jgi:hypothetical protein
MVRLLGKSLLELNLYLLPAPRVKEIPESRAVWEITDRLEATVMLLIQVLTGKLAPVAQEELAAVAVMQAAQVIPETPVTPDVQAVVVVVVVALILVILQATLHLL